MNSIRLACWGLLLMLALNCGGGSSAQDPSKAPPPTPINTHTPPWAETPTDPLAPGVSDDWRIWVEQHHQPLKSLDPKDVDTHDFDAWKASLAGKRIVGLGESSHGTTEFSSVKVRAIRFLHEEMGFDVMVFESSIFALHMKDKAAAVEDPVHLMQNSIFTVWNTADVAELFRYVQATQGTTHPLRLAGMDIQISTATTDLGLQSFLQPMLSGQDPGKTGSIYQSLARSLEVLAGGPDPSNTALIQEGPGLARQLYDAATWMDGLLPNLLMTAEDPRDPWIARQALWSRARNVEQSVAWATGDRLTAQRLRDEGMALNLTALAERVYPNDKLIVWAHNGHLAAHTDDRALYAPPNHPSTGTLIKRTYGDAYYAVGLFMYRGSSMDNAGDLIPVVRSTPNSLEAILYCARRRAALVELKGDSAVPGTSWMRTYLPCLYWGFTLDHMVPQAQFDAILFVDTTTPAVYLPLVPATQGPSTRRLVTSPAARAPYLLQE